MIPDLPLAPTLAPLGDSPRPALDALAERGFRHVQLSATLPGLRPRELGRSGRRDLAATLRRKALAVSGIDIWIPPDHFVDPAQVDRALAAVLETVELASVLGRCPVSLTLPSPGEDATEFGGVVESLTDHAMRHGVDVADHAVAVSSLHDLGIGIDPAASLGQGQDPARQVAAYAPRLISARLWLHDLGIGIDPAASLGHGQDPARQVAAHAPRLISARLCDLLRSGLRGPVGDGEEARLDVLAYRVALTTAAYSRPVVVDARQWPDPLRGLEQTRDVWSALDVDNTV
ncbi:MAG: sugar phosphate isomerase/epimerase family protein [Planctomycetota bacterium]|jgi:sugar phosphate isomerase/epimerase